MLTVDDDQILLVVPDGIQAFCPGYPFRMLLAPRGTRVAEVGARNLYTVRDQRGCRALIKDPGLMRRLEAGIPVLIIATSLTHLLPIIDRAERLVARGLDVTQLLPPDDFDRSKDRTAAACCAQCPAATAWATGARIATAA
jgi:hypothetical protein